MCNLESMSTDQLFTTSSDTRARGHQTNLAGASFKAMSLFVQWAVGLCICSDAKAFN